MNKVIVIGAGMSGLAAARELQHRRYEVLVVEARSRVGGRVWGAPLKTANGLNDSTPCTCTGPLFKNSSSMERVPSSTPFQHPTIGSTSANIHHHETHCPQNKFKTSHDTDSSLTYSTTINVDLGGALIHGTVANPLSQLCVQLGVATTENLDDSLLLDNTGWPVDPKQDEKIVQCFNDALEKTFQEIHRIQQEEQQQPSPTIRSRQAQMIFNGDDNFGLLFRKIAEETYGASIVNSPLWTWHQANLELSCGAAFEKLGYTWNDDEAYGFEGAHVALRNSWKTVVDALAEPLDIMFNSPVVKVQIVEQGISPPQVPKRELKWIVNQQSKDVTEDNITPSPQRRRSQRLLGHKTSILSNRLRRSSRTLQKTQKTTVKPHSIPSYDDLNPQRNQNRNHKRQRKSKQQRLKPKVYVTLQDGVILEADAVVCTVPLGVLKAGAIQFIPPLPQTKADAIAHMGCGLLNKCILSFPHVFWQDSDFLGLAGDEASFLILNGHKITGKPILIFMFGGESAFDVDAGDDWHDLDLVEECMSVLRKICKTPQPPMPLDYIITRWGQDAYAQMSFSYVPPNVKDGAEALRTLGEPLHAPSGRLMVLFAGEHTTPFHPSTIHGAFLSGIREAYRLDLTLEPHLNNGLAFDPSNLYQKTFLLKHLKRNAVTPSQSVLDWASQSIANGDNRSGEGDSRQHHRRRRHGAMTLRKMRTPFTLSSSTKTTPRLTRLSRHGSKNGLNESDFFVEPCRKSLRQLKSPMRLKEAASDDGNLVRNDSSPNKLIDFSFPCSQISGETAAAEQDELTLQRLVHQYPNWQVVASKVLPLYNSTKKVSVLKHRFQQLRRMMLATPCRGREYNRSNWLSNSVHNNNREQGSILYKTWMADPVVLQHDNYADDDDDKIPLRKQVSMNSNTGIKMPESSTGKRTSLRIAAKG